MKAQPDMRVCAKTAHKTAGRLKTFQTAFEDICT